MITIRWWMAVIILSSLLGMGVSVGYLMERMIHSAPVKPPQPSLIHPTSTNPLAPFNRDPAMEAGAQFMSRVTQYKQRLEENPNDMEALVFLGNANYDITRFEKAIEYYERVLMIEPENLYVRTDLSTSYYKMGQVDKALGEIQTVLEYSPTHETTLFNLGVILLNDKDDPEGAIGAWEKVLEVTPNNTRSKEIQEMIDELKRQG